MFYKDFESCFEIIRYRKQNLIVYIFSLYFSSFNLLFKRIYLILLKFISVRISIKLSYISVYK